MKLGRSDTVTLTNPPVGTIRWNTSSSSFEANTGTVGSPVWTALAATYSINAATASAWATGRTITLTGDATGTSGAFTGAANLSFALTLPTVNSNVGVFGSATAVPVITVNAKGQVTALNTVSIGTLAAQASSSVTITGGTITNVTHGAGNSWSGTAIPVAYGGTGGTTSTGTGAVVKASNATLVAPVLGTPASGNLANCTFPVLNQNTIGSSASCTGNAATAYGKAEGALNVLYAAIAGTAVANGGTAANISGIAAIANGGTGSAAGGLASSINTNTTAVKGTSYTITASLVLTLPASPTAGNKVGFSNVSGTTTATISPGAEKIMGTTGSMTLDLAAGGTLSYSGATYGWVLV